MKAIDGIFLCILSINLILSGCLPEAKIKIVDEHHLDVDTPTIDSSINSDTIAVTPSPNSSPVPTITATISPTHGFGSTKISPIDGMKQVFIPAGEFLMGSSKTGSLNEELPHYVYLSSYWIDETEITYSMFTQFLNSINYRVIGDSWSEDQWLYNNQIHIKMRDNIWVVDLGFDNRPVQFVNWYGANAYCDWAGRKLPTEAEWEKAARGEMAYIFPWGDDFECANGNFGDFIDSWGNVILGGPDCDGYRELAPVGSFETDVSHYGVKDMAGNVMEWVHDWYDEYYYNDSPYENPSGYLADDLKPWDLKVVRGGSYVATSWVLIRTTNRLSSEAANPIPGFRCVESTN